MAECALAVSFATVGGGVQIDSVDGDLLSDTAEARPYVEGSPTRRKDFVNCGPPLPGFTVGSARRGWASAAGASRGSHPPAQPQRDERLLQRAGIHRRGAHGRSLAEHRRPGLLRRRRAVPHRPRQGPADRQRPQHLAAGPGEPGRAAARSASHRCLGVLGSRRRRHRGGRAGGAGARDRSAPAGGPGRPPARGRFAGVRHPLPDRAGAAAYAAAHLVGQAVAFKGAAELHGFARPGRSGRHRRRDVAETGLGLNLLRTGTTVADGN